MNKGYRTSIKNDQKTVAFADIEIDGFGARRTASISGAKDFDASIVQSRTKPVIVTDYAPSLKSDPILDAYKVSIAEGRTRISDSEIKILEQVAQMTTANNDVSGKIRMVVSRDSCYSCQKVALDFRKIRPNIELEFIYKLDPRTKPINVLYDRIRNSF
jgi:hypothetical protein